ncbi:hypothetical protein [Marinicella rhabdoformis]|uniref:hypothetical protein n=1 Tax=Marinicella rhabdoformis TaxID=2580566 RepID=UPI0012AED3F4|nr:hypothetical protein [Marinicella rhabdoformis]
MTQYRAFKCKACGSDMDYAIGLHSLKCISCGAAEVIEVAGMDFTAHDYLHTSRKVDHSDVNAVQHELHCENCGADFVMPAHVHADECPYCDLNVVVPLGLERQLVPDGLMPFEVNQQRAEKGFKEWLHGLWFAPNALKRKAIQAQPIVGSYMPLWSFDADTYSRYTGSRGDNYVTTVRRNGETQTVVKTRWRNVSGDVDVKFDDLLVLGTESLPLKFQNFLSDWKLNQSMSYDARYLSGFRSELYTIPLSQGLTNAKHVMNQVIRAHIRRDIGGDHQRIYSTDTSYHNLGFQLILAPIWISAFNYNKKTFRYVINGQTGKAYGERPWSWWKIAGLVVTLAGLAATAYYYSQ